MRDDVINPELEDDEDETPRISMQRLSYNKETGEVKRDLFWVKMNAEGGDVEAMCNLGSAYLFGTDVEQDPEQAADWFMRAADEGESVAMFNLGLLYAKGFGVERDFAKAAEWMRKAENNGDEDAGGLLAQFEQMADTTRKAEEGNSEEQAVLSSALILLGDSNLLKEAGPEQDYRDALYWAWKAAKAGEPIAFNCLGIIYSRGLGTAKNTEEAFRWYLKAAESGLEIGMANVAYYYVYGKGVDIDLDKALEWFGKAVDNGWVDSNNELPRVKKLAEQMKAAKAGDTGAQADVADEMRGIGKLLENRNDDPQRAYAESLAWAIRATEANNPKGMRILAMAYQLGRGTEKDSEKGLALLQKGCDMNDTDCMVALAETYLNGEGVERSLDSAREWLTKAKNLGNDNAAELLNKLSGEGIEPDELMNMAVRAAIISLASGKTSDQVAEDIGLDSGTVSIINAIRLLRGFKRPDENVDDVLNLTTKMLFTLILSKLEKGQNAKQISDELSIPENVVNNIDQIDAFFRRQ